MTCSTAAIADSCSPWPTPALRELHERQQAVDHIVRTAAIAGTATAVSNRVSRRQAGRWARHDAQEQQAYAQEADAPEDAGPPADDDMDDKLAQLERLGNLKERGVLSEAEFAEQKQRILSG